MAFADVFRDFVERRKVQTGKSRQEIAQDCGFASTSSLSHYTTRNAESRRDPPQSRKLVLDIANGLGLNSRERNELLEAAGHSPDTLFVQVMEAEPAKVIGDLLEAGAANLAYPDREALAEVLKDDVAKLVAAWSDFFELRRDLYARKRRDLHAREPKELHERIEWFRDERYRPLRQLAARYLAHLSLLEAASEHHVGELERAFQKTMEAMDAALIAGSKMLECQCHVRLGDIERTRGRYVRARSEYDRAIATLDAWKPPKEIQKNWSKHWKARANRKRASLHSFEGKPQLAVPLLQKSVDDFESLGSTYELSRTACSLGWACSHLGQWADAERWYQRGLELSDELERERGQRDPRHLVDGHLGLATLGWQQGDGLRAEHHLDQARRLLLVGPEAKSWDGSKYHEMGRFRLLEGRIALLLGGPDALENARRAYTAGINFHLKEGPRDPARLASLYNAAGAAELDEHNYREAQKQFQDAFQWANASTPPNDYYLSDIAVYTCAIEMSLDEDPERKRTFAERARELCTNGKYWRGLAYLETTCAQDRAKHGDGDGFTDYAVAALDAATKFNVVATREVAFRLRDALFSSALSNRERQDLARAVRSRLSAAPQAIPGETWEAMSPVLAVADTATA